MVMKQSLVYLGNKIPTLYSKQPVFFIAHLVDAMLKKSDQIQCMQIPTLLETNPYPTKREEQEQIIDSKVPEVGWDMDSFLGGYNWLKRDGFESTGLITLPTQTYCTIEREILQSYHTFVVFHSPQYG